MNWATCRRPEPKPGEFERSVFYLAKSEFFSGPLATTTNPANRPKIQPRLRGVSCPNSKPEMFAAKPEPLLGPFATTTNPAKLAPNPTFARTGTCFGQQKKATCWSAFVAPSASCAGVGPKAQVSNSAAAVIVVEGLIEFVTLRGIFGF